MAEMSVRMTLTLVDTASPGVRAFMALLDQLGPKVTGLSNRLNTLESNFTKVSAAANSAAGNLGGFATQAQNAESRVGGLGAATSSTNANLLSFESTIRSVEGVLRGFTNVLTGFSQAFAGAANNIASATANMGSANAQMGQFTTRVHSLTHSLQGLAEVWAANKLFQGGEKAVEVSSDFQQLEARVRALNLPQEETSQIFTRGKEMSRNMGFLSYTESLDARLQAIAGLGRNDPRIIDATLPSAINAAKLLQLRGDKSSMTDLVRNLYGVAEARGQTSDPEAMLRTFNIMQQNATATGGKLSTKDVETILRQTKFGGASMLSDEGFINQLAFASQLKASGIGGGGSGGQGVSMAGTAFAQVMKWAMGGITNKETARLLTSMNIMDPNKIRDDSDTTKVNVGAGALKNAELALRDPFSWMQSMVPTFIAFVKQNPAIFFANGRDPNDPRAMDEALMRLVIMLTAGQGGVSVGQAMSQATLSGPASRIQEEAKLTKGAKDIPSSIADVSQTFALNSQAWHAAVESLSQVAGEKLLPALTKIVTALGDFVRWLTSMAEAHPTVAMIDMIALSVGALFLALMGFNRLFGIVTALTSMVGFFGTAILGVGSAWEAAGVAAAAGGATMTLVLTRLAIFVRALPSIASAFLLGWNVGEIIAKLDVGGSTVQDWVEKFMNKAENWGRRMRIYWDEFWGNTSKEEADKARTAEEHRYQNQDPDAKPIPETGMGSSNERWVGSGAITGAKPIGGPRAPIPTANVIQGYINSARVMQTSDDALMAGRPPAEQAALKEALRRHRAGEKYTVAVNDSPEDKLRRQNEAASQGIQTGPYDPNAKAPKRGYNEVAGEFQQNLRVARNEMQSTLTQLDAQFKAVDIGVEDYFNKRGQVILDGYSRQISELQNKLSALENPPKGIAKDQHAIDATKADLDMARENLERDLNVNGERRTRERENLLREEQDSDRQIEAMSGRRHKAELMRLEEITQKRIKLFMANGEFDRAADVKKAGERGAAGIKLDDLLSNTINPQTEEYGRQERSATESVKSGARGQMEADQLVYESRKKAAEVTLQYADALRELADKYGDPRMKKQVEDMISTAQSISKELSPEVLKVKNVMESSFTDFFNGLANHTKGIKALFLDLFNSIARGISALASQALAQQLGKAIFGNMGGTSSGSSSIFSGSGGGLFGMIGKLFGFGGGSGGSGGGTTDAGPELLNNPDWEVPDVELLNSFAAGIDDVPYDMVAQIHKGERVLTAQQNLQVKQGTSNLTGEAHGPVYNTFVLGEPSSRETQNQIAARSAWAIQRARRNM